jgi:hypothetical protein
MANARCGRENMNLQSIVSAVINNLHLMPNSVNRVNSNGSENADVELRNAFSIPRPRNSEQPTHQIALLFRARTYQARYQARYQVAFHGSKIMVMPGSYKEKEGNNHELRPMVGSKKAGKAAKGNKTVEIKR